jgi:hypothetical protein
MRVIPTFRVGLLAAINLALAATIYTILPAPAVQLSEAQMEALEGRCFYQPNMYQMWLANQQYAMKLMWMQFQISQLMGYDPFCPVVPQYSNNSTPVIQNVKAPLQVRSNLLNYSSDGGLCASLGLGSGTSCQYSSPGSLTSVPFNLPNYNASSANLSVHNNLSGLNNLLEVGSMKDAAINGFFQYQSDSLQDGASTFL